MFFCFVFLFYFLQILARIFPSLSEAFFHQRISLDCIFISVIIEVGIELLLVILNGIDALRCMCVDLTCLECARLCFLCVSKESLEEICLFRILWYCSADEHCCFEVFFLHFEVLISASGKLFCELLLFDRWSSRVILNGIGAHRAQFSRSGTTAPEIPRAAICGAATCFWLGRWGCAVYQKIVF